METKFQTSFIPKKPLIGQESVHVHSSTSIFMIIASLIFVVSLGAAAFTFVGKALLLKAQEKAKIDLAAHEKRFNLPLIEELRKATLKIGLAGQLLKSHIAASEALEMIEGLTAQKIRFSSFEFSEGTVDATANNNFNPNAAMMAPKPVVAGAAPATLIPGSGLPAAQSKTTYKIKMKGIADSYNSVAFQSDVFGTSGKYGTQKVIKNPVFSDLTVDKDGNVNFSFAADIAQSDITYEKSISN